MNDSNEVISQAGAVEAISTLARQAIEPFEIEGLPCVAIPGDMTLHQFPNLLPFPQRINTTMTLHTAAAFIAYWKRFVREDSVVIHDMERATFTAIFDYHRGTENGNHGLPAWCEHRAVYACPKTTEWKTWEAASGKVMDQAGFAYFIEQNLADISIPTGAEMLEIVTTLKAKTKIEFNKAIRLSSGHNELTYNELIDGKAGATGQLRIPEEITLGIEPFQGGAAYAVLAKFRYRIKDGNLAMWYDLIRPHKVNEAALNDIAAAIREGMAGGTGLMLEGRV